MIINLVEGLRCKNPVKGSTMVGFQPCLQTLDQDDIERLGQTHKLITAQNYDRKKIQSADPVGIIFAKHLKTHYLNYNIDPQRLDQSEFHPILIVKYCQGSKKHLEDPFLNGDFPQLHCLCIGLPVFGIQSDHMRKYMSKIQLIPNLQCSRVKVIL